MTASTTRDILIAEMLGDVGKVDDKVARLIHQVDYLTGELPKILNQMQVVISAQTAKADVLQEPVQRAIQNFIRQEFKGISVAVNEAKEAAVYSFDVDISNGVRKNMAWVQFKCKQSFEIAAKQFNTAVTESAGVAESQATQTLEGLCHDLKNRVDEIRAERWKGQYLTMLCSCIATGLVTGILAVYILK
jgi:hypothetical protein